MASSTLSSFGDKVAKVVEPAAVKRVVMAGGMAGKKASLEAASSDLGGDRAFSGMRRQVSLGVGFDDLGGTSIRLNFRPVGLWMLAERGRRGSGTIRPRRSGGKRAVTPAAGVARASSRWGPSRGLKTYTEAVKKSQTQVPKAAHRQFRVEVARAVGG